MRRLQKRVSRKAHMPELSLTPMIDTFCVLLVIFIVAAPMVQNSIKVDLPTGKSKEVSAQQDLVVTLAKDKKLYFNNLQIEESELVSLVTKAVATNDEQPVYVRADKTVSYGNVITLVDELKQAGVKYVAMSTSQT